MLRPIARPLELSPWLFPVRVRRDDDRVDFVRLSRSSFDASTFHDASLLDQPIAQDMSFDELVVHVNAHLRDLRPGCYIFHHAFCCSTLFARLLGRRGTAFDYREPATLTELAQIQVHDPGFLATLRGEGLLDSLVALHRRTEFLGEVALVKTCDAVAGIIEPLIRRDAQAPGILLFSDLDPFVCACLKSPERREWLRERARLVSTWQVHELARVCQPDLSEGQAAAYVWVGHMLTFKKLWLRFPDRLRPFDADALVADPVTSACRAAEFFGFGGDHVQQHVLAVLGRDVHAKTGLPYNAEARRTELESIRRRIRSELEEAQRWCAEWGAPSIGADFFIRS
jgi:hypothetical protein